MINNRPCWLMIKVERTICMYCMCRFFVITVSTDRGATSFNNRTAESNSIMSGMFVQWTAKIFAVGFGYIFYVNFMSTQKFTKNETISVGILPQSQIIKGIWFLRVRCRRRTPDLTPQLYRYPNFLRSLKNFANFGKEQVIVPGSQVFAKAFRIGLDVIRKQCYIDKLK